MSIDWSKPLELMDGTPVRLMTADELGSDNPDSDGDRWITSEDGTTLAYSVICPDGSAFRYPEDGQYVRNRAERADPFPTHPDFGKSIDMVPAKTLRDEFAMAALTGWIANTDQVTPRAGETLGQMGTRLAYGWADAMMAERAKGVVS